MSNIYDFNPSGLPALARIIQSAVPATASPDTPDPLPTPQGGLPAAAPTAPSDGGAFRFSPPNWIGNLARGYLAAGQPSVWGPAAAPQDTTAAPPPQAQPQQPSPMEDVPPTQWPQPTRPPGTPSPYDADATTGAQPSPVVTKPPEATKAPPRQEPYIRSRRDMAPGSWGRPDLVEQGAVNYPGMLPGPYMPQPHEWRGILQGAHRFLGSLGSGVIAPLAMNLAALDPAYWQARQRGESHKAQMAAAAFSLYAKQLAVKQAEESRDYGDAFAAFGPHEDAKGRLIPGDEDALRQAILEIAAKNHDTKIPAILARDGLPAVERVIRERDAHGKDHNKVLIQMQRENALRLQELRIKELEDKRRNRQRIEEIGLGPVIGTAPGATPSTEPDARELDQYVAPTETPETSEGEAAPTEGAAETPAETPAETAETPAETPETPARTAETPAETAPTAETPTPSPARPVRLAMRDTGTVSDAPQPGEPPAAPPTPPPTRAAEAAAPSAAPAAGTPEAMGATAPVPALRPRAPTPAGAVPLEQEIPAAAQPAAAPGAPAAPPYEFTPSRAVMDAAGKIRMTDSEGRARGVDLDGINTLAQQMVNHTVRIQDLRNYPDWYKDLARKRGDEIIRDMHRLAADPQLRPDQVVPALEKFNPEFAAQLKAIVEGRSPLPTSQWANPGYKNRMVLLANKIEPGFNEGTAKTIFHTYQAFTTGRQGDWVTSVGTAYGHMGQLEADLRRFPNLWARMFGGTSAADLLGVSRQDQQIISRIKAELDTVNSEYEYAVSRGRPTVYARRQQAEQAPLVFGNPTALLANIAAKKAMLRTRYEQLNAQFRTGTGQQPGALRNRLEEIGEAETVTGLDMISRDRAAGAHLAPAPVPIGRGDPTIDIPISGQGDGGVVDYRSYFGVQ